MSLTKEKQSDNDIAIAIDLDTDNIIYYTRDNDSDTDSDTDNVSLDEEELEELHIILDDYKSIKYREPHIEKYLQIKKQLSKNRCIKIKGTNIRPLPLCDAEGEQIQCIHVTGMSGCGKSHWTSVYIELYLSKYPNNSVFIFSKKNADPCYDKFPQVMRIVLDETFLELGDDSDDLRDALIIFDDIEQIKDDDIKKRVYKIKNAFCETGRSQNIFIISITHQSMNYKATRVDNNEMTACVVFPNSSQFHSRKILEKYVGLSNENIDKILNLNTRWCFVNKVIPQCIITKKKVELIK
jgi:hypothetical protein